MTWYLLTRSEGPKTKGRGPGISRKSWDTDPNSGTAAVAALLQAVLLRHQRPQSHVAICRPSRALGTRKPDVLAAGGRGASERRILVSVSQTLERVTSDCATADATFVRGPGVVVAESKFSYTLEVAAPDSAPSA